MKQAAELLDISREELKHGGYNVYTTMDVEAQEHLSETVKENLPEGELQVGTVTINHQSGEIVALQGGRDYKKSPFNRVTQASRMTGSTFKPILYYAALLYGFTPAMTLESAETTFQLENGKTYKPTNYGDLYANGPITLAQALAISDNIYAVKTNQFITSDNLIEAARTFGIEDDFAKCSFFGVRFRFYIGDEYGRSLWLIGKRRGVDRSIHREKDNERRWRSIV